MNRQIARSLNYFIKNKPITSVAKFISDEGIVNVGKWKYWYNTNTIKLLIPTCAKRGKIDMIEFNEKTKHLHGKETTI